MRRWLWGACCWYPWLLAHAWAHVLEVLELVAEVDSDERNADA